MNPIHNKKELSMFLYDKIIRLDKPHKLSGKDVLWWLVEFEEKE